MKNFKMLLITTAAAAFLSSLPVASAQTTPTKGVLNLTACGGGGIQVTLTDIFFVTTSSANRGCTVTGAPTTLTTGLGPVAPNIPGEILNLNVTVCNIFTTPGCTVPDFIRFPSLPNLHFDLSLIGPGPHSATCPNVFDPYQPTCGVFLANPAAGLPYDSPFYLLATTTGTAINLPIFGQVRENTTVTGSFIGTLSTQEVGTSPAAFQVKILTKGMQQSSYDLSMLVTPVPAITAAGVVNAASNQGTTVSPGEIVTIYGTNLSPVTSGLQLLPTHTVSPLGAGTAVLFDGVPAPLISTSPTQISVVAPYEITTSTKIQVLQSLVVSSNVVSIPVAATAPGIFTVNGSGTGQINMSNQDGSLNSATNAAAKGTVVTMFATGEGVTSPAGADGVPTSLTAPGKPVAPVSVTVGGVTAPSQAVEAPGAVAGVLQINVTIPTGAASGAAVPVVLTIGGVASQTGATMAIQ
jgi:uncharacterized protein (TIGR03437 family)